jgi:excinuclease UvrABC nuclease subunit
MPRSTDLSRNKTELQAQLKQLPTRPGIYRFYDAAGSLVYVGKSVCLRDRVRSYFSGKADCKKVRRLRQEIARLDWEETGSELEALLLESRLVKRHQPRFNVLLRGFVPLPYVRVDLNDPYPRLDVTRSPARDGATYFGPFHSQATLEAGVSALANALKLRDCSVPGERIEQERPCYRHEFGHCSAPCLGLIPPAEYRQSVESACAVLEGRQQSVLDLLQERMMRAAERLQFEIAARLRDVIRQITAVSGRQQALISAIRDLSLVAVCPSRRSVHLCLFVFRSGRLVLQEDVPVEELQHPASRREWSRRLIEASRPLELEESRQIDTALLDEIQIVTAWMKQKTREGAYWEIGAGAPEALSRDLEAWIAELPLLENVAPAEAVA